ncbi:ankyrin repeat-containing domain protein [Dactylonectria macrodidyma]|uniref:Ankyrin repeat-containing domain protein n=1 Tax=Dactylonectria macrodidyma TaxID=307937 RepID=A0A9P9ELI4_9HYPO|nr:ankyrin repeat-containing domain protein [Dactylonectria macrodidyma]
MAAINGSLPHTLWFHQALSYVNVSEPSHGRTPILAAIENGHEAIARHLVEEGALVDTGDTSCGIPLILTARDGRVSLVKLLVDVGADVGAEGWHGGQAALSLAAVNGHGDIAELLLQNNAATDLAYDTGRRLLAWAIEQGHDKIIRILVNREVQAVSTDADGSTILPYAAEKGFTHATLFSAYTDVIDGSDEDRLECAFERGYTFVVKHLLQQGTYPDHEDKTERTPLILASNEGRARDDATLLLEHGAQPFPEVYFDNVPPLQVAASHSLDEIVALFLKVDPASNKAKQEHVLKAVCSAVDMGRLGLLDLLFERYSPVYPDAETPLEGARYKCCGPKQTVRLFRPYFSNEANDTDSDDSTSDKDQDPTDERVDEDAV